MARKSDVLLDWPYCGGPDFMTPAVVWSAYTHENRMRVLTEIQLTHCAARIRNQREEIKRLQAEVDRRKRLDPEPLGS